MLDLFERVDYMQRRLVLTSALVAVLFICPDKTSAQSPAEPQRNEPAVVAPVFPPIARSTRTKGEVVIEVTINSEGKVTDTKVISGPGLLYGSTMAAARKWKFDAAKDQRSARLIFAFGYVDGKSSDPEYLITFLPAYKIELIWNPPPGY
jgi:TonB family protein